MLLFEIYESNGHAEPTHISRVIGCLLHGTDFMILIGCVYNDLITLF